EGTGRVHPQHAVPHLVGGLGELGAAGDAGVVHEDQRFAERAFDLSEHRVDLYPLGDVADERLAAPPGGTNPRHGVGELIGGASRDRDIRAGRGQSKSGLAADAAAAAGDQGNPPGQFRHRQCSPRILVSLGRSMVPPETMQAMRPLPGLPESATASATAPAPSAITRLRSAIRRSAAAISSRLAVNEPSSSSCCMARMFGKTSLLPKPSKNEGW